MGKKPDLIPVSSNKFETLEKESPEDVKDQLNESDDSKRGLKRKLTNEPSEAMGEKNELDLDGKTFKSDG